MKKTTYQERLRDVITFLVITIGIPTIVSYLAQDNGWFVLLIISWVPAVLVTGYLRGEFEPEEDEQIHTP